MDLVADVRKRVLAVVTDLQPGRAGRADSSIQLTLAKILPAVMVMSYKNQLHPEQGTSAIARVNWHVR